MCQSFSNLFSQDFLGLSYLTLLRILGEKCMYYSLFAGKTPGAYRGELTEEEADNSAVNRRVSREFENVAIILTR